MLVDVYTLECLTGMALVPLLVTSVLEQSENVGWSDTAQLVGTLAACVIVFTLYFLPLVLIGELLS